jgi:ATP-dependent Clp protease adapter protein ClpS
VVKKLTMKIAYEICLETHKSGKATVTQAWKTQAEIYCLGLQQCGLTASIAPDSKFEGGKGGGGGGGGDSGGDSSSS